MSSPEVEYFEKTGYMGSCASYLAGVVAGDGGIYPRTNSWSLELEATDRDFVAEFRRCAEAVKGVPVPKIRDCDPGTPSNRNGEKTAFKFKCGWTRWQEILSGKISDKYRCDWLRGIFDSEGGVEYYPPRNHRAISFSNSNPDTLRQVRAFLEAEGIHAGKSTRSTKKGRVSDYKGQKIKTEKDCFHFPITNRQNLERFRDKIGFSIWRKQGVLEEMLSTYKNRLGVTVAEVTDLRFNRGKTIREITQELGCSQDVIYRRLHQTNREGTSSIRKYMAITVAEVADLRFNQKKAYKEIAQALGCSKGTVFNRLRQAKRR